MRSRWNFIFQLSARNRSPRNLTHTGGLGKRDVHSTLYRLAGTIANSPNGVRHRNSHHSVAASFLAQPLTQRLNATSYRAATRSPIQNQ